MAHLTVSVEYGIHSLLCLASAAEAPFTTEELADLQEIPPNELTKIFPKLESAGIVRAAGVRYMLAKSPEEITLLEIVDAIEGKKPIFECQDIRGRCAVFGGNPPGWVTGGVCGIHAAILRAERAMRESLASQTLGDIAQTVGSKAPPEYSFSTDIYRWLDGRATPK